MEMLEIWAKEPHNDRYGQYIEGIMLRGLKSWLIHVHENEELDPPLNKHRFSALLSGDDVERNVQKWI